MMQDEKLIELFESYTRDEVTKKPLVEHGAPPTRLPEKAYSEHFDLAMRASLAEQRRSDALSHAAWMATQAIDFIKEAQALETNAIDSDSPFSKPMRDAQSKREKAHRWLGFIQGTLWLCGLYTLDELKEQSRKCSDEPEKAESK